MSKKLSVALRESFFGEAVTKVEKLTPDIIKEIIEGVKHYIQTQPDHAFEIEFDAYAINGSWDIDHKSEIKPTEFDIDGVKSLIEASCDDYDFKAINFSQHDIEQIFSFLKGYNGHVKKDSQTVWLKDDDRYLKVSYDFHIESFSYRNDMIITKTKIKNVNVL